MRRVNFSQKYNTKNYQYKGKSKRLVFVFLLLALSLCAACVIIANMGGFSGLHGKPSIGSVTHLARLDAKIARISVHTQSIDDVLTQTDTYPPSLLDLLSRNPEVFEFVLAYPAKKDAPPAPKLDAKEVTAGIFPHLLQWDTRWGYALYGDDLIALTGCAPTCLSMAAAGLTGDASLTPAKIAFAWERDGHYIRGVGTSWQAMSDSVAQFGLQSEELPLVETIIRRSLRDGKPVVCSVREGDFTISGHFILLAGIASNGDFIVHDPNSVERTAKTWTFEELEPQISNLWSISIK